MLARHLVRWLSNPLRSWYTQRRRKQEQWHRDVDAYHLATVRQREEISDEELIAREPGIPGAAHPMEMNRRLKAAVIELTGEVVASRRSADRLALRLLWVNYLMAAMTAALVALTVVLAVRG